MAKTKSIIYSSDGSPTGTNILSSGPTDYTKDPSSSEADMKLVVLSVCTGRRESDRDRELFSGLW